MIDINEGYNDMNNIVYERYECYDFNKWIFYVSFCFLENIWLLLRIGIILLIYILFYLYVVFLFIIYFF